MLSRSVLLEARESLAAYATRTKLWNKGYRHCCTHRKVALERGRVNTDAADQGAGWCHGRARLLAPRRPKVLRAQQCACTAPLEPAAAAPALSPPTSVAPSSQTPPGWGVAPAGAPGLGSAIRELTRFVLRIRRIFSSKNPVIHGENPVVRTITHHHRPGYKVHGCVRDRRQLEKCSCSVGLQTCRTL